MTTCPLPLACVRSCDDPTRGNDNDDNDNGWVSTGEQPDETDNFFTGTELLVFEDSTATMWANNSIPASACVEINGKNDFATGSDIPLSCE